MPSTLQYIPTSFTERGYNYSTPMHMNRFTEVFPHEDCFDTRYYERVFSGRLTKARYKSLARACRVYSRRPKYRCGCEHDCCGCLCSQYMTFTYSRNQVVINFTQGFNY